ncbi:reverse transcriptase [Tanacetum coccineum]
MKISEPKEKGGIGFRDLEAFNTALLAKQGWRLLMNPGAFWGKVLNGIYFPNCGFLVAKRGSHPSWIWSSLLHGRDLLLQGVRWQVGDGRNISFWTQKWIPYSEDFYIRYPLGPFKIGELVSGFILNGEWNLNKLHEKVSKEEADFIMQILISKAGLLDKLVWHFDAKGRYTVKSGYEQAILKRNTSPSKEESTTDPSSFFWKKKLTHHSGTSISHRIQSFTENINSSLEGTRILTVVATVCWSIWCSESRTTLFSTLVKINCDVAFKDSKAAYGIVVRDCVGTLVRVSGKPCFATSPLHAEVIAIHYACYLAYNQGWCGAIVESDSQTVISLSSSEVVPPWSLSALIDDICTWSKSLHLSFSWVNRVNNQVAHWTAQFALSSNQCIMWDVSFPYELTSLARSDLYGS